MIIKSNSKEKDESNKWVRLNLTWNEAARLSYILRQVDEDAVTPEDIQFALRISNIIRTETREDA